MSIENESNFALLQNIISYELDIPTDQIQANTNFSADLGADSIDSLSILAQVNNQFNIQLKEKDVYEVDSVGHLYEVIIKHTTTGGE